MKLTIRNIILVIVLFAFEAISSQNINILWFDATSIYGPGSGISVIVNPTDTFALNNKFKVELSDNQGNWTNPQTIKEVAEFYTPVLNAQLPANLTEGRYKLRIKSTNPEWIEETPSFEIKSGVIPQTPSLASTLINNSTYFNCQDNNIGGLFFGSLNQQVGATSSSMNAAQRIVRINDYVVSDTYNIVLFDVLNNNQIPLTHQGNSITLPDNLKLGTYVLQVTHANALSSTFSAVFLFHGNGTNLGNSSSEEICVNNSVFFGVDSSISGIGRNYNGSKYQVNFGDGSDPVEFTHVHLSRNPNIQHVFRKASCSETGSSFNVQIQLFNKGIASICNSYSKNGTGVKKSINVSVPPTADFNSPAKSCINTSVTFVNNTIPGFYGKVGCKDASNFYWYYKKPSENSYTLVSDEKWQDSKGSLTLPASVINEVGCWKIKIEAQNQDLCQVITINEKTIMIEAVPVASFTSSADSVCIDNTVHFTNTTNVLNQSCNAPVFSWIVNPDKPENSTGYIFESNADNASIKFTKPGVYTVKLKVTNACGEKLSSDKKITVAGGASISLPLDSVSACITKKDSYTIDFSKENLKPVYNTNYGSIKNFKWKISGTNVTSNDYIFAKNTNESSAFPVIEFKTAKKYFIIAEIESDCQKSDKDTLELTINEIPELVLAEKNQTICSGSAFKRIVLDNTQNDIVYTWRVIKSNNLITTTENGSGKFIESEIVTNTADTVGTIIYQILPVSGLCSGNEYIYTIYVNPSIKATFTGNKDFCLGAANAKLKVVCKNGISPYTISYTLNNGTVQQLSTASNNDTASISIPTYQTGKQSYKIVDIKDSNPKSCNYQLLDSIVVEIADNPIIATQPTKNQTVCKGAVIEPLAVICVGGAGNQEIQWYINTSNNNYGGQPIAGANILKYQPQTFSTAGDYYFYCTITMNASNCGSATSEVAHVQVINDPTITNHQNLSQVVCKNAILKPIEVQAQGGTGNLNYQWFVTNDTINSPWIKITEATDSKYTPENTIAGTKYYFCEVSQNAVGCSVISRFFKVELFDTPAITKQPLSLSTCKSEPSPILTVEYAGGSKIVSYQWFTSTDKTKSGATAISEATEHKLTVPTNSIGKLYYYCQLTFGTEGCGVLETEIAEITVNQYPIISNQTLETVSGLQFAFVPTAKANDIIPTGTTFTWALPQVAANSPLSGMTAKTEPQTNISDIITNLSDTIASVRYTVTPQANGCSGESFSLNVIVLPALNATVKKQNISCFGDNNGQLEATVYGGVRFRTGTPYLVSWIGPNGFSSSNMRLTNLAQGEYILTVSDSLGIEITNKYIVEQPEKLTIKTEHFADANCSGVNMAAIDVSVSGGKGKYTFKWVKNNILFSDTEDIKALQQGKYELTVTDENECIAISEIYTIHDFDPITIEVATQENNNCFGGANGSIKVNVKGGNKFEESENIYGYKFSWKGSGNFTNSDKDINNLISGVYELTVTDKTGCTASLQVNISQATEIVVTPYTTPVSCFGKNDATITLSVEGGKAPYTAEWSNFATGLYQENVSPGEYTIKVIDANKCEKNIVVKIEEESRFTVIPTIRQISCNGAKDGSIQLSIKSNRSTMKVKWADGSTAGNERNNLSPGIYSVEVSDGGPCIITNSFVISEPTKLSVSADIKNAFGCDAANSGSVKVNVTGGKAPYTYQWSNGTTDSVANGLLPGTYFVTVTDFNACNVTTSYELIRNEPLKVLVNTKSAYCNINKKYKEVCSTKVTGGVSPYSYSWSAGDSFSTDSATMETFSDQTIALIVTDAMGCSATTYFTTEIQKSQIETQTLDCNNLVYKFDIQTPPAVFTNLAYNWDFGDGTTSNIKSPTHIYLKNGEHAVKLKITSNEGELNFDALVNIETLPMLKLDREPRFCKNDSVEIIVSGADSYLWNDGTRGNRKMIKREGNYSVVGISVNGCTSTLNFTAKHYDYQNFTIESDKNVLTLNDPTLKVWSENVDLTSYNWNFGDSTLFEGNYADHTYDIDSPVTLKVKLNVVNPYGCQESAEKTVWLIMESIPNTFTPNSDGVNDRFLKGAKVQIFNSNGIILYEGTEGWDGTYKGKRVAMDTYYYVVYYSTPEGIVNKPGFVFLAN